MEAAAQNSTPSNSEASTYPRDFLLVARTVAISKSAAGNSHKGYKLTTCALEQLAWVEPAEEHRPKVVQETMSSPSSEPTAQSSACTGPTQAEQPHTVSCEAAVPPPPTQAPILPPALQASIGIGLAELHQPNSMSCEVAPATGPPPPPTQPPSAVTLSLQASLPPPWEAAEASAQPVSAKPVALSLCAAVAPPSSPSLLSWQTPLLSPSSAAPLMPASLPPSSPPSLPPMLNSPMPALAPPALPPSIPAALSPMAFEAPPCWDAGYSGEKLPETPNEQKEHSLDALFKQTPGIITPTTCSGSEVGFSAEDGLLHSSGSEADLYEGRSLCGTPVNKLPEFAFAPPPGLELSIESPCSQPMSSPNRKAPARALCLDCLL